MNIPAEIASYLTHGDHAVAVRRTLDFCLDTGDDAIIQKAIIWSRRYHEYQQVNTGNGLPPDNFLTEANEILETACNISAPAYTSEALLEATQISKTYTGGGFSLKPLNLRIDTGHVLGVVGENGNGKTTLLRCLAGQLALDSGNIHYPLLQNPDTYAIKNHIAFIPQRIPRWFGRLKDNLHFSASIAGVYAAQNDLMVNFMLERLGLTKFAHLTWNQISSGYRTRFEIARVLLQKPRLLILDEPLANLDINAQQTILTDLIFMAKGSHNPMGIVLSSQQLHEVEKVANEVVFIKQGNSIFNTTSDTTLAKSHMIEFETTESRDGILTLFATGTVELKYNGGFYTIGSVALSAQQIIETLVAAKLPVTYFRDITYSSKRFF